jgi:hypothetical protein
MGEAGLTLYLKSCNLVFKLLLSTLCLLPHLHFVGGAGAIERKRFLQQRANFWQASFEEAGSGNGGDDEAGGRFCFAVAPRRPSQRTIQKFLYIPMQLIGCNLDAGHTVAVPRLQDICSSLQSVVLTYQRVLK